MRCWAAAGSLPCKTVSWLAAELAGKLPRWCTIDTGKDNQPCPACSVHCRRPRRRDSRAAPADGGGGGQHAGGRVPQRVNFPKSVIQVRLNEQWRPWDAPARGGADRAVEGRWRRLRRAAQAHHDAPCPLVTLRRAQGHAAAPISPGPCCAAGAPLLAAAACPCPLPGGPSGVEGAPEQRGRRQRGHAAAAAQPGRPSAPPAAPPALGEAAGGRWGPQGPLHSIPCPAAGPGDRPARPHAPQLAGQAACSGQGVRRRPAAASRQRRAQPPPAAPGARRCCPRTEPQRRCPRCPQAQHGSRHPCPA